MAEFIELFVDRNALIVAIVVVYLLLVFFPLYWPAIYARPKRANLARPFLYIFVIATVVYGAFAFLTYAIRLPLLLYAAYIEPILVDKGLLGAFSISWQINQHIELYGTFLAVPVQVFMTIFLTRWLGLRWSKIVQALAT